MRTKERKLKTTSQDPRQSEAWGKTLSYVGWKVIRSSSNVQISVFNTFLGSLIKIQRPHTLIESDFIEIDKISHNEKALFIKIEPSVGQDIELMQDFGYRQCNFPMAPPKTMYMDLTKTEKDLWEGLSESAKYSINRARREGTRMEIIQAPLEERLTEYHSVLKYTGLIKGFPVEPLKNLLNRSKVFSNNAFLVFAYDKNNNLDSAKFYIADNQDVLYVHGGTSELGRKTKAGYLLLWESILYFKNKGFVRLDLEGLYDPRFPIFTKGWEGFTKFKEKFNGEIVTFPYPHVKYLSIIFKSLSKVISIGI